MDHPREIQFWTMRTSLDGKEDSESLSKSSVTRKVLVEDWNMMEMVRYENRMENGFEYVSEGEVFLDNVKIKRGKFSCCKFLNRILRSNSEAGSLVTVYRFMGLWLLPLDRMGKHDHFRVEGIISDSVKNWALLNTAETPLFWSQLEGRNDLGVGGLVWLISCHLPDLTRFSAPMNPY